ncbi:hypothetical protein [Tianweitania aestuarii]
MLHQARTLASSHLVAKITCALIFRLFWNERTAGRFVLRPSEGAGKPMSNHVKEEALLTRLAVRHDLSRDAVKTVFDALRRSGGGMAQFNHPDFGGMAQWSPGMTMVGDMFNNGMKAKLDAVATELAAYLKDTPAADEPQQKEAASAEKSGDRWWPSDLGSPSTSGSQNAMRYAVFPEKRRLVIDEGGTISVYDTGDHRIHGVAQAQSSSATLKFTSQSGTVDLTQLKKL